MFSTFFQRSLLSYKNIKNWLMVGRKGGQRSLVNIRLKVKLVDLLNDSQIFIILTDSQVGGKTVSSSFQL